MRKLLRILGYFILILLTIVVALFLYIGTPYFTATAGTWLTHKSGRNVVLSGKLETHLFSRTPRFTVTGVKIGNAEWGSGPAMFAADRIEWSIEPLQLLRGRVVLPELILDRPKLLLEKNAKGDANWELLENPQAAVVKKPVPESRGSVPIIGRLKITDGEVAYNDPAKHINTKLKVSTAGGTMKAEDSLSLSGDGSYQNQPFTLKITGDSVLQLRESDKPYHFTLKTGIGGTSADVEGSVSEPVKGENFDVTLRLKGANAAELFPLTGIALPPTPAYDVSGHLTRDGNDWKFNKFQGKMGTSDLKGDVVWHPAQKPPYFEGSFVSDNLNMADLAGFVGGQKKPDDPNRVIPDTQLDISRLIAMNADVNFHGRHIMTPQLLDDFTMDVHLKDGVLELKPLAFSLAKGKIDVDMKIEGREAPPAVTIKADFEHLSLASLFAPLAEKFGKENVSAGTLIGEISLKGKGKSMQEILSTSDGDAHFAMDGGQLSHLLLDLAGLDLFRSAGLLLAGDEPVPTRCVVADFGVTGGVMGTRALLIDTDVTQIRGKGEVNLQNEKIDFRLYTYPKKPSILSARTPLVVDGTLKHPNAGVDKVALAARGGAAALLALLTPPAALVAFIEPGLGPDSNCVKVLQEEARKKAEDEKKTKDSGNKKN